MLVEVGVDPNGDQIAIILLCSAIDVITKARAHVGWRIWCRPEWRSSVLWERWCVQPYEDILVSVLDRCHHPSPTCTWSLWQNPLFESLQVCDLCFDRCKHYDENQFDLLFQQGVASSQGESFGNVSAIELALQRRDVDIIRFCSACSSEID